MASIEEAVHFAILSELADQSMRRSHRIQENPYVDTDLGVLLWATKRRYAALGTARIENYVDETVPRYSDPLFKAHFRMSRSSFQELLELLGPLTEIRQITLERRTLACLWYLSNMESFRGVVDRFGLSKGSLHYFLGNFCRTLTSDYVLPQIISWPKVHEYTFLENKFAEKTGFPGVIGALDGTHIPIPGPGSFRDSYICRKGYPAMHLQGVCDSGLKFTDVYCAYPGSVHDARVFRNSPLFDLVQNLPEKYHLLGDSAYPLSKSVLVPFRDNGHLTNQEKIFNFKHSSTRTCIEHGFGLLKGKFRKLKYLDMRKVKDIPTTILACCVLHNFILVRESYCMDEIVEKEVPDTECHVGVNAECRSGADKRLDIMHQLV